MSKALLISTDGQHRKIELPKDDSYEIITDLVGGYLDSVSNSDGSVVGYLHDEGLLIGLPVNTVASLLFSRPLVGNVVLVGGISPEGEYDGENHDLPDRFFDESTLAYWAQVSTNDEMVTIVQAQVSEMDLAPKIYSLTDDEMTTYLTEGKLPTE